MALGSGATLLGNFVTAFFARKTKQDEIQAQAQEASTQRLGEAVDRRIRDYTTFLELEQELRTRLGSGAAFGMDDFADWYTRFTRAHTMLMLTGSPEASRVAARLNDEIAAADDERRARTGPPEPTPEWDARFAEELYAAYSSHAEALERLRGELISTMHRDVTPTGLSA